LEFCRRHAYGELDGELLRELRGEESPLPLRVFVLPKLRGSVLLLCTPIGCTLIFIGLAVTENYNTCTT